MWGTNIIKLPTKKEVHEVIRCFRKDGTNFQLVLPIPDGEIPRQFIESFVKGYYDPILHWRWSSDYA